MKKVISVIIGVATGFVIVYVGDATCHAMHPMPAGLNLMDKNVLLEYVSTIPKYILIIMSCFWMLSAYFGGLVCSIIAKEHWKSASLSTGAILMAASLLNLIMTAPAHPLWMWIVALAGYVPIAFLGAWVARRKDPPPAEPITPIEP
jgi:ABC-type Na+ efflux pump permease subunit